jgi:hypothetical protein
MCWRSGTEAGEVERRGSEEAGARAGRRAFTRRPATKARTCHTMGKTTRGHHCSRLPASTVVLTLANSRHGVNK